eukprot:GHVS01098521.1.p1 GENE.GHVS01098521.1~~GHVS01098521.1.p1  ORF type:complete len:534 (-),score=72.62 GHVS01098521.1:350-1864(-)
MSSPFTPDQITEFCRICPTPFHLYDEQTIRATAGSLFRAFDWVGRDGHTEICSKRFNNFFAVKALPNPHILNILKDAGFGMDCSSLSELLLCESIGLTGERIMLTSNNTQLSTYRYAKGMGVIINLDDLSHLEFLEDKLGLPDILCFRFNPGALREGNVIIGRPEDAKFGMTREQLFTAYKTAKDKGVKRFGLHTMVVSNCLDVLELVENARMCLELAVAIKDKLGICVEFVNCGGGIGVPYQPGQKAVDFAELSKLVKEVYTELITPTGGLHPLKIVYENGRCITGPAGCLVTRVIHQKDTYKKFIGVDASIANLMRPALYHAYHHMTVVPCDDYETIRYGVGTKLDLPKNRNIFKNVTPETEYDVVGSLCENNDKLAENRRLGVVRIGDIIVVHDTGAHGHSMGFNYNGLPRSAEYLHRNGEIIPIRRAESYSDLFRTIEWSPSSLLPPLRGVLKLLSPAQASQGHCLFDMHCGSAVGGFVGAVVGMGVLMLYMRARCAHHN